MPQRGPAVRVAPSSKVPRRVLASLRRLRTVNILLRISLRVYQLSVSSGKTRMCIRAFADRSIVALAGIAVLSASPAQAFAPVSKQQVESLNVETVQYRGWGWGGAAVGGLAAGAIIGSALAPRYYGPGPAYYDGGYGPCWRQEVDPYGRWFWARVC
jgi:hypothetical protein